MPPLSLRPLRPCDLDDVAAIHCAAFPKNAFTRLGCDAVRRYYAWQLEADHEAYAIAAFAGGAMAGYCFGGIVPSAIGGFLARNRGFIARRLAARPWLIADPLFAGWARKGARFLLASRRTPGRTADAAPAVKRPFDILAIAVHPSFQGYGAGKALMARARRIAAENGFHVMTLFVDPANDRAIGFYQSLGWEKLVKRDGWRGAMELWFDAHERDATCERAVAELPNGQM